MTGLSGWLAVYIDRNEMYNAYVVYMKREHRARRPVSGVAVLEGIRRVYPAEGNPQRKHLGSKAGIAGARSTVPFAENGACGVG